MKIASGKEYDHRITTYCKLPRSANFCPAKTMACHFELISFARFDIPADDTQFMPFFFLVCTGSRTNVNFKFAQVYQILYIK